MTRTFIIILFLTVFFSQRTISQDLTKAISDKFVQEMLTGPHWLSCDVIRVKKVAVSGNSICVTFNDAAIYVHQRESVLDVLADSVRTWAGNKYRRYGVKFVSSGCDLRTLIPNYYRYTTRVDTMRTPLAAQENWIVHSDRYYPAKGLTGRNIALWNSHGLYYDQNQKSWEWQRARLFTTVEDLLTSSFVLPYLLPMLENAGANVLLPRERDLQSNMVVVDNDDSNGVITTIKRYKKEVGYKYLPTIDSISNPFTAGTSWTCKMNNDDSVFVNPCFGSRGSYAVYVAYVSNARHGTKATYIVNHSGGQASHVVDQRIGGSQWVYLGTYDFPAGECKSAVVIKGNGQISVDAVRFGGGKGSVIRGGSTSGRPAWMEGARYHLQANGAPYWLYSPSKGANDYTDDINSRGEWVNRLAQQGICVDMALAIHTDAGITQTDSTIGTLAIVNTRIGGEKFANGKSKMASRDLADYIQAQLVEDVRRLWLPKWSRRGIWDKSYSEARRPQVPTVLLEMLSHQNFNDMRLALNPQFRFDAGRAIYKGILHYLGGPNAIVQPLPIKNVCVRLCGTDSIAVCWQAETDSIEPSAVPTAYRLQMSEGSLAFDNGVVVKDTFVVMPRCVDGKIRRFRVSAINDGGESMLSPIAVARFVANAPTALIVDGFTRIDAPAAVSTDAFAGFFSQDDPGVPFGSDCFTTGNQFDYAPQNKWLNNYSTGWGNSYADAEGICTAGNNFDVAYSHAQLLSACNYSLVSTTMPLLATIDVTGFDVVDFAFGNQKCTRRANGYCSNAIYTDDFKRQIERVADSNRAVIVSGSYVGTDVADSATMCFVKHELGFAPCTNHASKNGEMHGLHSHNRFSYVSQTNDTVLAAVPDAILAQPKCSISILRYADSGACAATLMAGRRVAVVGIPLETSSVNLMQYVLDVLKKKD